MNKKILKNKFIIVLIIIVSIPLYKEISDLIKYKGKPYIFEMKNVVLGERNDYYPEKYYMIINPPNDLDELKELTNTFLNEDRVREGLKGEKDFFIANFYRESKKLSRDWKARGGFFRKDIIDFHKEDFIASVRFSSSGKKEDNFYSRKTKDGNSIEYKSYKGDRLVRWKKMATL